MTEKRFKNVEEKLDWGTIQYFTYNDEKITDDEIENLVNQLLEQNEQLKQSFINLIDKKIEEFQNGDYGDLPCNTIHMFLDLKKELKR